MKFYHWFVFLLLFPLLVHPQAGAWTWMQGDSTPFSQPGFGLMGVPSPTNTPPGLYAAGFWTDTAGNLWVYGGLAYSDLYGEDVIGTMWQYNPVTMNWTWMAGDTLPGSAPFFDAPAGVFDPLNDPGALGYGIATWTDKQNHLWMYGGASDYGTSSDLWQYDPVLNQWAWMNGSQTTTIAPDYGVKGIASATNTPGSRSEGNCTWVDAAGNLWFFGGLAGIDDYNHNDMWEYNVSSQMWVWMSGSNNHGNPGVYGPLDSPSVNYYPSARTCNFHWQDKKGNFWLIGGGNLYNDNNYNDVWNFNPSTLEWTLLKGSGANEYANISSDSCQANATNEEGGRYENRAVWKVTDGLLINYAGYYDYWPENVENDLWAYLPGQNEWLKINQYPLTGMYGTQAVTSPQDYPTGRIGSCSFIDKNNNLWMFGGLDADEDLYNDLWKYVPDTGCIGRQYFCNVNSPDITPATSTICPNDSANICAPSGFSSYNWNNNAIGSCIEAKDTGTYFVTVTDYNGCTALSNNAGVTLLQSSPVTITANTDSICPDDSASICAPAGFTSYAWNNNNSANCIAAKDTGNYYVTVTDNNGCTAQSNPIRITMLKPPQPAIAANKDTICPNDSAQICAPSGFAYYAWNTSAATKCIEASGAGNYYVTVTDNNGCTAQSNRVGITVLQSPSVGISRSGDTLSVYDAFRAQWYLNNNPIPGADSSIYIARTSGSYTVQVTDTNGCPSFSSPIIYTGIENVNGDENISIYPNPLSVGSWQLAVGNEYIGSQIEILDADGRVVYKSEIKNAHSEIATQFAGGVYLLRITSGTTVVARKLVKL